MSDDRKNVIKEFALISREDFNEFKQNNQPLFNRDTFYLDKELTDIRNKIRAYTLAFEIEKLIETLPKEKKEKAYLNLSKDYSLFQEIKGYWQEEHNKTSDGEKTLNDNKMIDNVLTEVVKLAKSSKIIDKKYIVAFNETGLEQKNDF